MTGPDLTLIVLLACGGEGPRPDADAVRPCQVEDVRGAKDQSQVGTTGDARPALPASEVPQPPPAKPKEVFYSITLGADLPLAMRIANRAAGIVVGKLGTAVVSREEIVQDMGL